MFRPTAFAAGTFLLLLTALFAGCGGDDDDGDEAVVAPAGFGGDLAARILRIGETAGTVVEARGGELVAGLEAALNPDAMREVGNAVDEADDRLTLIAETAGLTADDFAARWEDDPAGAFALFTAGVRASADGESIRTRLFLGQFTALPVHPGGVLVGSGRIARADGTSAFFLAYDVEEATPEVESAVARQLDQSPWQVTGGRSNEELIVVLFQSTTSADIQGLAWVQAIDESAALDAAAAEAADADADEDEAARAPTGPIASVVYLVETQPLTPPEEQPFVLPPTRPLPDGFPAPFLVNGDKTVTELAWDSIPGGSAYQVTLVTAESSFEVADDYRGLIEGEGWELVDDQAVGFATVLQFTSEDGAIQGSARLDAFAEDDTFTEILLQVQATSRPADP